MDNNTLILYILVFINFLLVSSGGLFALIKYLKSNKISDKEWEAQCNLLASMLEKGVDVPKEIIIAVLRRELTSKKFAESIKQFRLETKKKGK